MPMNQLKQRVYGGYLGFERSIWKREVWDGD